MRKIRIKICLLAAMLAVATGIQASDFVVDELCYNITDAEAKTVEVAKYDYTVDGEMGVSRNLVGINFRHPNVMPNFAVWKTITYRHWHRWCCQPRF